MKRPVLDLLEGARVFCVTKQGDSYEFEECCDNYYSQWLSADEVRQLITELEDMLDE